MGHHTPRTTIIAVIHEYIQLIVYAFYFCHIIISAKECQLTSNYGEVIMIFKVPLTDSKKVYI